MLTAMAFSIFMYVRLPAFMILKDIMNYSLIMETALLLKVLLNMDWIFQALQRRRYFLTMIMTAILIVIFLINQNIPIKILLTPVTEENLIRSPVTDFTGMI